MALSAAEQVEVRRQAGYPAATVAPADALAAVLAMLSPEAEVVLRVTYLPALVRLELAVIGTTDTLDTAKAAVWERNAAELAERMALYRAMRFSLCRFLGIDPGIGLFDPIVLVPGPGGVTDPESLVYVPAVFVV